MTTPQEMIVIEHLQKSFKEVRAVDDLSFRVTEGQLFAFLGLNGAGKSTTINIICHALPKDAGTVRIAGLDIDTEMTQIYPKLGVVFQNSILDTKLTVYDNLWTRAVMYGLDKQTFTTNLQFLAGKLAFADLLHRPLHKLSGGQKRRIDLARALIHRPQILILDEPTTGLDPQTRILVWALIDELRRDQKLTVLLTTHYMEEAAAADYVVIIDHGRIVAEDTPNNLKNQYAHDIVKIYQYDSKLPAALEQAKIAFTIDRGVLQVVFASMTAAKDFLVTYAPQITDFEAIKGNMDSVFLAVTGKKLGGEANA